MADSESPTPSQSHSKDSGAPRIRRRNRMITSCLECRRRKLKCDKLHPCTNCSKFSRECMFLAPALDSVSQKKLNELKDKMGSLEKVLETDIARQAHKRNGSESERLSPGDLPGEDSGSDREIVVPEDESRLEPTALAVPDAAYEDSASDDLLDLGVRLGKMRLTERFGGTFRPLFAEEIGSSLGEPPNTNMSDPTVHRLSDHDDFLGPGPNFIAPGSGFLFGDVGPRRNLIDFLPAKSAADTLVQKYYHRVHFIARVVHWPSFQLQYESFWNTILSGFEPQPSLQALVFAIWFSAVVSMDDEDTYALFASDRITAMTNLQTATEVALGKANYLRTSKIETLQAMVVYLIPMIRDEISRAHSVLVGSALRLAECMGLHRDPETFGMSPIVAHVRRTLWFQLCWLDYRTAEAQAPRPYLKRDDYDTRFPMDINDLDLMAPDPKERGGVWTDMTLSRLRFECVEILRVIGTDYERMRQKKISITHLLGKVESFRRAMEAKYHPVLDVNIPIQAYAKHLLTSYMSRLHVAVLHRFHHNVKVQIPERLQELLISSGVRAMENFIILQRKPEFKEWSWISSSITTWITSMLLLIEIFVHPHRREADQIWAILEFTFGPDPHLTRDEKARQILRTIRDRAAFYRNMRGMKEPVNIPSRQALVIRMREQQSAPDRESSILLKQEGNEVALQSIQSHSQSVDRRSSLTRNHIGSSNAVITAPANKADDTSWTFDSQSTLFQSPVRGLTGGSTPICRVPSVSPLPPANSTLPPRQSVSQAINTAPSLDNSASTSPGSSSTNTDVWPPPMSGEQHIWSVGSMPHKQQMGGSIDQRLSAMSQINPLPSIYSQRATPGPLPFVAGGNQGVEAMLQSSNAGYITDDAMSLDIDWGEWDKIFPQDVNPGNITDPQLMARQVV